MKIVKNSTDYSVELPEGMSHLVSDDGTLYERLDELPVFNIDYNGHFGDQVEFSVLAEDDCQSLHNKVMDICLKRLKEIKDEKMIWLPPEVWYTFGS